MKRTVSVLATAAFVSAALMSVPVRAQAVQRYFVMVTNMTRAQSFTPILVATHTPAVRLFVAGTAASSELRELAEEGSTNPFTTLLRGLGAEVRDVVTSSGLLTPGVTAGIEVIGGGSFDRISVASMLIPTNDAFFGVTGVALPTGIDPVTIDAPAYDAGTERNDERCASIPGPNFSECGGPGGGARVGGGEGAVTIHNGIRGVGDMRANDRDWRNPVARITIHRVIP
ncbi:MAG: spondin domain-containing protein [Acidobacteria bacterium]|nr:spondin domain-containing protein [Acidobacteriota bacterium]